MGSEVQMGTYLKWAKIFFQTGNLLAYFDYFGKWEKCPYSNSCYMDTFGF